MVLELKVPKYCQWLKIYRMPLNKYLRKKMIELFKKKIKSVIRIQLNALAYWFISKNCLKEQQEFGNK